MVKGMESYNPIEVSQMYHGIPRMLYTQRDAAGSTPCSYKFEEFLGDDT